MSEFIPIVGYETLYSLNQQGEVKSHYYGIILKHGWAAGYPKVSLYRLGHQRPKTHHIHRLLAIHFIPNPLNLPQVNHIDGNPENFELENLEWCTASYNVKDGYNRGRGNGWGTTRPLINRTKICEYCKQPFSYKRKSTRFCSTSCSAKWRIAQYPYTINRPRNPINGRLVAINLIKSGILKAKETKHE